MNLRKIAIGVFFTITFPTTIFAASSEQKFVLRDTSDLLKQYHITEPVTALESVQTDSKGENHAFVFIAYETVRIYRNEKRIFEGDSPACMRNEDLVMTDDGNVFYTPDCKSLFFNEKLVERYDGLRHATSYSYEKGIVTYGGKFAVKQFTVATGKTKTLYRYPPKSGRAAETLGLEDIQSRGGHIAYSIITRYHNSIEAPFAKDVPGVVTFGNSIASSPLYSIYLDGKLVRSGILNLYSFHLSRAGIPYYFEEKKDQVVLYAGKRVFFRADTQGTTAVVQSIFEDESGGIWHTSFSPEVGISLFHDRKEIALPFSPFFFSKKSLAFRDDHYALVGFVDAPYPEEDTLTLRVILDGKYVGDNFTLSLNQSTAIEQQDLVLGINNKVYLRRFDERTQRWIVSENGVSILSDRFDTVLFLQKLTDGSIAIYGTAK